MGIKKFKINFSKMWELCSQWFDKKKISERLILTVAISFLIYYLMQVIFINPLIDKRRDIQSLIEQSETIIKNKQNEEILLNQSYAKFQENEQKQLIKYKMEIENTEAKLKRMTVGLIASDDLVKVLEKLLSVSENVQLISLKALPQIIITDEPIDSEKLITNKEDLKQKDLSSANVITENGTNKEGVDNLLGLKANSLIKENNNLSQNKELINNDLVLYQNPVELKVLGDFSKLGEFLVLLEKLEWRFYWQSLDYKVVNYPKAEMTLYLYSLSADSGWLGVE